MKNKTLVVDRCDQPRVSAWMFSEEQEDDFLSGKTPHELQATWEDEE